MAGCNAATENKHPCFACDRLMSGKYLVACIDEQTVFVGSECFKKIRVSGADGWQPPKGGPRLFTVQAKQERS